MQEEETYADYFGHNRTISSVLSLFCGFIFTAITLLLTSYPNIQDSFAQTTLFFLTFTFYVALYTLVDNLEMGFHYIKKIPPLTFRVSPFFRLILVFYLFGTAVVLMFILFGLQTLAIVTGVLWGIFILVSIVFIVVPFFRQSFEREWRTLLSD